MNISGAATTETIITGLTPSTIYTIQVAAVNNAGIGEYTRNAISSLTSGECFSHSLFLFVYSKNTFIFLQ